MFGFFVMGFVDIVGITTSYVKNDFSHLTDTMVNLISLSCFLWFLVLSIPTGMLMSRPLECAFTPNNQHINI